MVAFHVHEPPLVVHEPETLVPLLLDPLQVTPFPLKLIVVFVTVPEYKPLEEQVIPIEQPD